MATLVLGVLGRAVLGPVGGLIGTLVGGSVDRRLLGSPRREGRRATPEVQAASYGEPIPLLSGRMRLSGNVIWATPVRETVSQTGGGKRGPSTTNYAYSASFAVLLCAGSIVDIGRIWADGKLIRDAGGQWLVPASMRVHRGGERQPADPLIAAAEGVAPAFRGCSYVVFEDLQLAEFGNRLPNLSFEVLASNGPVDLGEAIPTMASNIGLALTKTGQFPSVDGLYIGASGPFSDTLGPILTATGAVLAGGVRLVGTAVQPLSLNLDHALDASAVEGGPGARPDRDRQRRMAAGSVPDVIEISYYDVERDYQPGLQRSRIQPGARTDIIALPIGLDAPAAKRLCTELLVRATAKRQRRSLRLPWRFLGITPGDILVLPDGVWQVVECRFEGFVLSLDLVRAGASYAPFSASDGGRALVHGDVPAGPTTLVVMDLPPLPGELPDRPRLWLAGAGQAAGWRRAGVAMSLDGGMSYTGIGILPAPATMGRTLTALASANPATWDELASVDVELLSDGMWLEGRSRAAVLAGGNLAMVGDELIQFEHALPLGDRRFRLSGLLRGRRGTDWAVPTHGADEAFVVLDPAALLQLSLPIERLGEAVRLRLLGSGDSDMSPVWATIGGEALRPLAPVHLRHSRSSGEIQFDWIPQSRAGFGWPDLTDVPLAEPNPLWRLTLRDGTSVIETLEVTAPTWRCADRSGPLWLEVAQVGHTLGRSAILAIP